MKIPQKQWQSCCQGFPSQGFRERYEDKKWISENRHNKHGSCKGNQPKMMAQSFKTPNDPTTVIPFWALSEELMLRFNNSLSWTKPETHGEQVQR